MSIQALTEIARDEAGQVLWSKPYRYKRLSPPGEEICEEGAWYVIVSQYVLESEVHTTVRRIGSSAA